MTGDGDHQQSLVHPFYEKVSLPVKANEANDTKAQGERGGTPYLKRGI